MLTQAQLPTSPPELKHGCLSRRDEQCSSSWTPDKQTRLAPTLLLQKMCREQGGSGSRPSPLLPSELTEHGWAAVSAYCKQHRNHARNQITPLWKRLHANAFWNTCIPPHLPPPTRRGVAQCLWTVLRLTGWWWKKSSPESVFTSEKHRGLARAALCLLGGTSTPSVVGEPFSGLPSQLAGGPSQCQHPEGRAGKAALCSAYTRDPSYPPRDSPGSVWDGFSSVLLFQSYPPSTRRSRPLAEQMLKPRPKRTDLGKGSQRGWHGQHTHPTGSSGAGGRAGCLYVGHLPAAGSAAACSWVPSSLQTSSR